MGFVLLCLMHPAISTGTVTTFPQESQPTAAAAALRRGRDNLQFRIKASFLVDAKA